MIFNKTQLSQTQLNQPKNGIKKSWGKQPLKYGLSFAIIAICLVATAVAVYWIWSEPAELNQNILIKEKSPVPSGVEGWQTYRNEEYGFEFKYPNDWNYEWFSGGSGRISPLPIEDYAIGSDNAPIHFSFYTKDRNIFLENHGFGDYADIEFQMKDTRNQPDSIIVLDGKEFEKHDLIDYGRYEETSAGNVLLVISPELNIGAKILYLVFEWQQYPAGKTLTKNNKHDFLKILSTLKFSETVVGISGRQTYRNEEYGFEVYNPYNFAPREVAVNYGNTSGSGIQFLESGAPLQGFSIEIFKAIPYENAWQSFDRIYKVDLTKITKTRKLVDSISAAYYEDIPGLVSYDEVFFIRDGYFYGILFYNENGKQTDQILSTFKFIETDGFEEAQILSIDGWLSYSFQGVKSEWPGLVDYPRSFSLKYPPNGKIEPGYSYSRGIINFEVGNVKCQMSMAIGGFGLEGEPVEEETKSIDINGVAWDHTIWRKERDGKIVLDTLYNYYSFSISPEPACMSSYKTIFSTVEFAE